MTSVVFLYVTAPNSETAARIGRALVEEKLAACVNIHAEMRSVYTWEGRTEIGLETPLFVKTTDGAASRAKDRIKTIHPHDEPCIVGFEAAEACSSASFLDWVKQNTE